jgi:hypothetical protein
MNAKLLWRLRLPATLVFITLVSAGCGEKPADRPAPPETAAPAPAPTVAPAEDRGHTEDTASESPDSAFDHVESGEAERAASQRGHDSAGEPAPANQPGSGE